MRQNAVLCGNGLMTFFSVNLKVALQIVGQKFYKNTKKKKKKSSLYSQSLLIFIHRTPLVERHPITREIRDLLWPMSTPTRKMGLFLREQLVHLHTETKLQLWRSMKI